MTPSEARYNEVLDVLKPLAPEFGLVAAVNLEAPSCVTGVVEILTSLNRIPAEDMETLLTGFFYKLLSELHGRWVPKNTNPLEVGLKLTDYLARATAQYVSDNLGS